MKQYIITSTSQTGSTTVVALKPSRPSDRLEFRAGQYVAIGFKRSGRKTPMRCFSVTNEPNAAGELQLAFRAEGNFTTALSELVAGDAVAVTGPFGQFFPPTTQQYPLVYLAAGIGITPFMSLLRDQAIRGPQVPTTLLYSSHSLDDRLFASELLRLQTANPWLTVRFLVSELPANFQGHPLVEVGRLNADVLERYFSPDADYYVCGPPGYNSSTYSLLAAHGIYDKQYHSEAFAQGSKLGVAGFAVQKLAYSLVAVALVMGIGGTYALDALKAKQKTVSAQTTASNSTPATATTSNTATNSTDSTSQSTATSTATTPSTTPQNNSYSQPVSRMS